MEGHLFKYCKRKDMEALLAVGSVRIGTLFNWRAADRYGEMSADEFEGIIKHSGNLIFYDYSHVGSFDHRPVDSTVTVEGEGANEVRHFTNHFIRSLNVYTFCTSSEYSEEQHRKWLKSDGYDACYRINSAHLFFGALTAAIGDAEFLFFEPVQYVPDKWDNLEIFGRFHPALLKRAGGYDDQLEVRAVWKPLDTNAQIDPFIIAKSRAAIYCEAFRVMTG